MKRGVGPIETKDGPTQSHTSWERIDKARCFT